MKKELTYPGFPTGQITACFNIGELILSIRKHCL